MNFNHPYFLIMRKEAHDLVIASGIRPEIFPFLTSRSCWSRRRLKIRFPRGNLSVKNLKKEGEEKVAAQALLARGLCVYDGDGGVIWLPSCCVCIVGRWQPATAIVSRKVA